MFASMKALRHRLLAGTLLALAAGGLARPAAAVDVKVVGLSANKAIVVIGNGAPRTLAVGQRTAEGVLLAAVNGDSAVFEIDGTRRTLQMGQHYAATGGSGERVVLAAAEGGHFLAAGQVNGGAIRFLVDTGATSVALPAHDAQRLGIDYKNGARGMVQTANGVTTAYRVKLDTVTIGGLTLNNVDAVVLEGGLTMPLLGMTFLNRTSMQRDGETLVLTKRF